MKRSNKLSLVSLAALSLPITAAGVAAAQNVEAPQAKSVTQASRAAGPSAEPVENVMPDPAENAMEGWSADDLDAYAAYWAEGYNYAQLLFLADEWNVGEFEAKGRAGRAILAGDISSFEPLIRGIQPFPAEVEVPEGEEPPVVDYPDTPFWDAGFVYEDALALAAEWNIDSYEAKVRAAGLIEAGNQAEVEAILGQS